MRSKWHVVRLRERMSSLMHPSFANPEFLGTEG